MAGVAKNVVAYNELAVGKVARSQPPKQTEWKIKDVPGLSIIVMAAPSTVATFSFRYRVGDKVMRKTLGRHGPGGLTLADAKAAALELMSAVSKGANPVADERAKAAQEAAAAAQLSLRGLFEERAKKDRRVTPGTLRAYREGLELLVFPKLGDRIASEIAGKEIAVVLREIASGKERGEGGPHAAHKCQSALGSTYRWAKRQGLVEENPTFGLGFAVQSTPRDRILTDKELANLWLGIETAKGLADNMRIIFKLGLLTGQRRATLAGAKVSELSGLDGKEPVWRIPAGRMKVKTKGEQIVPLSMQAAALFKTAIAANGASAYVFPADTAKVKAGEEAKMPHVRPDSVSTAMIRLRSKLGLSGDDKVVLHDARRCIVTWLKENRVADADVRKVILHHADKTVTERHYEHANLQGPVRIAYQAWADHVSRVTDQAPPATSNVVELAAVRA